MIYSATGHRPNKLGGYTAQTHRRLFKLATDALSNHGLMRPEKVISGMAQGWDTAWAEAAIELDIPLICALPFDGQELEWPALAQQRYKDILTCAAEVRYISDGAFEAWKYIARNKWMVDHSNFVIALWDGSEGGTHHCVKYAESVGTPVTNLWSAYLRLWKPSATFVCSVCGDDGATENGCAICGAGPDG